LTEALPPHVLHHNEGDNPLVRLVRSFAPVVDLNNGRMVQGGRVLSLASEPKMEGSVS
jgi:hypothetical protein